jgi:hypothetical protein
MKISLVAGLLVFILAPASFAFAADSGAGGSDSDESGIVILAVKPRSPDVRPIMMSVTSAGHDSAPANIANDKPNATIANANAAVRTDHR